MVLHSRNRNILISGASVLENLSLSASRRATYKGDAKEHRRDERERNVEVEQGFFPVHRRRLDEAVQAGPDCANRDNGMRQPSAQLQVEACNAEWGRSLSLRFEFADVLCVCRQDPIAPTTTTECDSPVHSFTLKSACQKQFRIIFSFDAVQAGADCANRNDGVRQPGAQLQVEACAADNGLVPSFETDAFLPARTLRPRCPEP